MSLGSCPDCWDVICTCADARGFEHMSNKHLLELIERLQALLRRRILNG